MRSVPEERPSARLPLRAAPRSPANGQRNRPPFLAAVDGEPIVGELRRLLADLLGSFDLEVLPPEGSLALARLRVSRPRLAFVSMNLRRLEGLTLLRALPASRARQVVLLVPDTLEGYRRAWDGLYLGARDFLVTRGAPPQRLKGRASARIRQLAHLLRDETDAERTGAVPGFEGAWRAEAQAGGGSPGPTGQVWVVLAESRHLPAVAAWLRGLAVDLPVLLPVPEGRRLARVAAEGLGRLLARPVRIVGDGDRLVPGHVHLLESGKVATVERDGRFARLRVTSAIDPPGSLCAQLALLRKLASSGAGVRVVLPEPDSLARDEFLAASGGRHELYRLVAESEGDVREEDHGYEIAPRRLAA